MMPPTRADVDAAIASDDCKSALAQLRLLFNASPGMANAQFVLNRIPKIGYPLPMMKCRMVVLRSFTVEPVLNLLRANAALYGVDLKVVIGDFNTYVQEILDSESLIASAAPQIILLAIQTRDLLPSLWDGTASLAPEASEQTIKKTASDISQWVRTLRSRCSANILLQNFELPSVPSDGVLDQQKANGQMAAIQTLNQELVKIARANTGTFILDYDGLVARYGRATWTDERKWLTARMPIATDNLDRYAKELLRFILPLAGKTAKALVLDLDNTLWGGVIGEDGINNIQLSKEYPGAAFRAVQKVALDLYRRGILLAICSKNNPDDAIEAITKHPEMLLEMEHFAAVRINWQDKAQNLREIAHELNIGVDSLVFLDDNPVERQRVARELPEVTVIELPSDPINPMAFAPALRDCPLFERLSLSEEDANRGKYYAEQRQRAEMEQSVGNLEEYYRSLDMVLTINRVSPETIARTAQLTQKTNQFNLTTRRYSEPEISAIAEDGKNTVFTISVQDKFGDNGLVGVSILRFKDGECEIDTLLMSCRVIGRTVETAFLSLIADYALSQGAMTLTGWYLPTKKNPPCQDFYPKHGFHVIDETPEGTLWELALRNSMVACPEWIHCVKGDGV